MLGYYNATAQYCPTASLHADLAAGMLAHKLSRRLLSPPTMSKEILCKYCVQFDRGLPLRRGPLTGRRIAVVKPSFYSHVSNQSVRDSLQAEPLKQFFLLKRQLLYFGYLAAKPSNNVLRNFVFATGSVMLRPVDGPRRKGRPRSNWIQYLHKISLDIVGGDSSRLENLWASTRAAKSAWREAVGQYCAVAL